VWVDDWMFLLVPAHPGSPGQNPVSRKMVVCVCALFVLGFVASLLQLTG